MTTSRRSRRGYYRMGPRRLVQNTGLLSLIFEVRHGSAHCWRTLVLSAMVRPVDGARTRVFFRPARAPEVGAKQMNIADEGVAVEHTMPARIRLRIGSRPENAVAAAAENGNGDA